MTDPINPDHYRTDPSGIECIQITRHRNFAIGSALKYLWRAGLKTEQGKTAIEKQIEDLEKAIWFIRDEIQRLRDATTPTAPANGIDLSVSDEEWPLGRPLNTDRYNQLMEAIKPQGTIKTNQEENMNTSDINEALRGVKEGTHELRAEHGPELIRFDNKPQTISDLQYKAHAMAEANGFWDDANKNPEDPALANAFIAQKLALIHSEVTEALDELRDNQPGWIIRHAEDGKPEGLASELADIIIRTLDLAEWLAIDLGSVIEEKMAYNATRPAKHGKNF